MDNAPALSAPIRLDEHDAAAVVAILIRTVRLEDEIKHDQEMITELNAKIATDKDVKSKGITALSIFGFDSTSQDIWKSVRLSIGNEAYEEAIVIARGGHSKKEDQAPKGERPPRVLENSEVAKADGVEAPTLKKKIADIILEYLQAAQGQGAQVAEIRKYILMAYGLETHEKTPGMTLFRLQKQGLVRRTGRTWYFVPPSHGGRAGDSTANETRNGRSRQKDNGG